MVRSLLRNPWLREQDVLLQGGSAYRDRAKDEVKQGLVAYRGTTGEVVWKDRALGYGGPALAEKCIVGAESTVAVLQGQALSSIRIETPISESVGSMVARGLGIAIINPFTALNFSKSHDVVMRRFEGADAFVSKIWKPLHTPSSTIVDSFEKTLFDCRDEYLTEISAALG